MKTELTIVDDANQAVLARHVEETMPVPGDPRFLPPAPPLAGPLIPLADCHAIICVAASVDAPMGIDAGSEIAARLIGLYPNAKAHDSVSYMRGLSSAFANFPVQVGSDAALEISRTISNQYNRLPDIEAVHSACKKIVAEIRALARFADQTLKEYERRRLDDESFALKQTRLDAMTPEQIKANADKLRDFLKLPGAADEPRPKRERRESTKSIGDVIPDAIKSMYAKRFPAIDVDADEVTNTE